MSRRNSRNIGHRLDRIRQRRGQRGRHNRDLMNRIHMGQHSGRITRRHRRSNRRHARRGTSNNALTHPSLAMSRHNQRERRRHRRRDRRQAPQVNRRIQRGTRRERSYNNNQTVHGTNGRTSSTKQIMLRPDSQHGQRFGRTNSRHRHRRRYVRNSATHKPTTEVNRADNI